MSTKTFLLKKTTTNNLSLPVSSTNYMALLLAFKQILGIFFRAQREATHSSSSPGPPATNWSNMIC